MLQAPKDSCNIRASPWKLAGWPALTAGTTAENIQTNVKQKASDGVRFMICLPF